jgi:hypothetical protein
MPLLLDFLLNDLWRYSLFMPKRTNTFQTLVYLLKRHIEGNTKVVESAELVDRATGSKREVDVCITTEVTGHIVVVSLECRDHKRPQNIEWVEQMYGKHSTLPTNHLVLVSKSGFTPQALAKAKLLGIETVVPDALTETEMSEFVDRITRLSLIKVKFLDVENIYVVLSATETDGLEEIYLPSQARSMHVFNESGQLVGTMDGIIKKMMQANAELSEALPSVPSDARWFQIIAEPPELIMGDPSRSYGIFVKKMQPIPHLRRIERLGIEGRTKITYSDFPVRYTNFSDALYAWGESVLDGRSTVVVITESGEGEIKLSQQSF